MPPKYDNFCRKCFLGLWTGFAPKNDEITRDPGESQAQYCYSIGDEYRIWVHRAETPRRWFGAKRTTRRTLLDQRKCSRSPQNYCTDGCRLLHLLIVGTEKNFQRFLMNGVERPDLRKLEWYVFPDEQLPAISTDGGGTAENYHIYRELLENEQHYRHDGQQYLPYKNPSLVPDDDTTDESGDRSGETTEEGNGDIPDDIQRLINIAQKVSNK